MKLNVILDHDCDAHILARRLKGMGYTVTKINAMMGMIECEKAEVDFKLFRRMLGVQSVEAHG